jgi:NCAIR mutase (PurE)-related protein
LLVAAQDGLADATLDHDRARRCGYPEVVFGQGKTPDQIAAIAKRLFEAAGRVLITRADERAQEHLRARFPRAYVNARARIVRLGPCRARAAASRSWPRAPPTCRSPRRRSRR